MAYNPKPIHTHGVELSSEIAPLVERLAEHNHDIWARQRMAEGWTWGPAHDDAQKTHPCLIPYAQLPESEKLYDINSAIETLKAVVVLGYRISRDEARA